MWFDFRIGGAYRMNRFWMNLAISYELKKVNQVYESISVF